MTEPEKQQKKQATAIRNRLVKTGIDALVLGGVSKAAAKKHGLLKGMMQVVNNIPDHQLIEVDKKGPYPTQ